MLDWDHQKTDKKGLDYFLEKTIDLFVQSSNECRQLRLTSDKLVIWRILMMNESIKQVNLAIEQMIYLSNFVMNYNT